ncbi:MAG: hypothetical protein B6245_18410 [Desulfobacteraceae bacterium 4572_88]|nr:MAG: hypothetical protein B6245_18410 [Desulfobacteraceae bacterium 4572_88]
MNKKKKNREFVHIGNVLNKTLKRYRYGADAELTKVWKVWNSVVGEAIAENVQPAAFKGKLLLVHVSNPIWIQHLQFEKAVIIENINQALGKPLVEEMKFKVGPLRNI